MDRSKKTLINVIASAAGYIIPASVVLITTPLLIHLVGKSAFGIQGLSNTVLGYFLIMDMNIDMALIKFLAEDNAKNDNTSMNNLLNMTFKVYLGIGLLGMILIALSSSFLVKKVFLIPVELISQARLVFLLTSCGFFASSFNMWIRGVAMGLQRYDFANTLDIFSRLFGNVLGILAAFFGLGIVGYTFFKVFSGILVSIVFFFAIRKLVPFFKLNIKFDFASFRRILSFTTYGVLLRISGLVLGKLDILFIGMWIGAAAVGIYSIPFIIYSTLSFFLSNMFNFLFPMSSELYSTNKFDELKQIFIKLSKSLTTLAVMLYLPMIIFGTELLKLWVGTEVAKEASGVFIYLIIAGFLGTIFIATISTFMVGIGNVRMFTIYSIGKGLFNCGLFVPLIKIYGIDGAGITLLISTLIDLGFLVIGLNKFIKVGILVYTKKVFLSPVITGLLTGAIFLTTRNFIHEWWSFILITILLECTFICIGYPLKVFGDIEKKAFFIISSKILKLKKKLA